MRYIDRWVHRSTAELGDTRYIPRVVEGIRAYKDNDGIPKWLRELSIALIRGAAKDYPYANYRPELEAWMADEIGVPLFTECCMALRLVDQDAVRHYIRNRYDRSRTAKESEARNARRGLAAGRECADRERYSGLEFLLERNGGVDRTEEWASPEEVEAGSESVDSPENTARGPGMGPDDADQEPGVDIGGLPAVLEGSWGIGPIGAVFLPATISLAHN